MTSSIEEKTIELENGLILELKWYRDDFGEKPWDHCEVADKKFKGEWESRGSNNYDYPWSKRPYEVIIAQHRGSFIFYDFQDAVRSLRKQGCAGIEADKAARAEVRWLQDWFNDTWYYAELQIKCPKLRKFETVCVCMYEYPTGRKEAEKELISEALEQIKKIQANFRPDFYPLVTA